MDGQSYDHGQSSVLREQDRFLPIANVSRIMKKALPSNAKIAKDAKECVQECVSEFISFITSEASDKCKGEKRKTINGEDILYAMQSLGFDNYIEPLRLYLQKYRDSTPTKSTPKRERGGSTSPVATPLSSNIPMYAPAYVLPHQEYEMSALQNQLLAQQQYEGSHSEGEADNDGGIE